MNKNTTTSEENRNYPSPTKIAKATLSGLSIGTVVGSVFGPTGTLVGAMVGSGAAVLAEYGASEKSKSLKEK